MDLAYFSWGSTSVVLEYTWDSKATVSVEKSGSKKEGKLGRQSARR